MLDFHSVKTLRLRAFACLGTPASYSRAYMGLRDAKMIFHPTPAINKLVLMDYDIVKNMQHTHSLESKYFSGLASVVHMVSRSKVGMLIRPPLLTIRSNHLRIMLFPVELLSELLESSVQPAEYSYA